MPREALSKEGIDLKQAGLGGKTPDVNKSVPLLYGESGVDARNNRSAECHETPSHGASVWGSLAVLSSEVHGDCR